MELPKVIEQLEDLIKDRGAFIEANEGNKDVFVKDKKALEEAVKVLTVIRDKRQVTFTADPEWVYYDAPDPGGNSGQCGILMGLEEDRPHIKIRYDNEELTIKEMTDRLNKVSAERDRWKQIAKAQNKRIDELEEKLTEPKSRIMVKEHKIRKLTHERDDAVHELMLFITGVKKANEPD